MSEETIKVTKPIPIKFTFIDGKDNERQRQKEWKIKFTEIHDNKALKETICLELIKITQIKHFGITPNNRLFIEIIGGKVTSEPIKEQIYNIFQQLNIVLAPNDLQFQYFIKC